MSINFLVKRLNLVIGILKHNHRNITILIELLYEKSKSMKDFVVLCVLYRPPSRSNGIEFSSYYHLSITLTSHNHDFLLTFFRCCIGEFDTWSSNIFQLLICAKSTTTTVREISAFFYANGLPLLYSTLFYLLCNE